MSDKLIRLIIQLKDEASTGIEKMNGSLGRMAEIAGGTLIAGAIQAAGRAVVGLGGATITAAADFEAATARFASVAGGSLAEAGFSLEDVKNKALEMGAATQFSAAEAQEAMINLAKGGVPVTEIMSTATQATLDLAAAGEIGLASAADIVSKQLGVWASTGVTAAEVSNTLAQAANASTVDVEELAMGLAQVGGVAKVSGVSFVELNTTMAMLAPGFASASDAATSLKTMLINLSPKSTAAAATMMELGIVTRDYAGIADELGVAYDGTQQSAAALDQAIRDQVTAVSGAKEGTEAWGKAYEELWSQFQTNTFYDANGQLKEMDEVAQILQDSLAGLSEEQKTAALNTMFGTDAFRAAAFMAEGGAEGYRKMAEMMAQAGTAAEQAAIRNATFKFALDSLKGSLETIMIIVGSALLPILTGLINAALIPGANAVMSFVQALIASSAPWQFFVESLNAVLPGLGTFVDFIVSNAIPILSAIGAMILAVVVPAFWTWATASGAAAIATLTAMAPLILIIGAIGLAVGLLLPFA